jgi:hypothetical protein
MKAGSDTFSSRGIAKAITLCQIADAQISSRMARCPPEKFGILLEAQTKLREALADLRKLGAPA